MTDNYLWPKKHKHLFLANEQLNGEIGQDIGARVSPRVSRSLFGIEMQI
jgi:hypothetical protein